jgi:hypothetical protein
MAKAATSKTFTTTLTLTKSTKGTHVYGNSDEGAPIPQLYIKRAALSDEPAAAVEVVVTEKTV